jgi:bifunctional non-homologous end joining protein LigD
MNTFVIRQHDAYRAGSHQDLHLDGMSFAVPKGVPFQMNRRVLAIRTSFHNPEQARFEGEIPKGEYGAGTSKIVDEGEYEMLSESPNHMYFYLEGSKYTGRYVLRHWEGSKWLLWRKP